MYDDYTWHGSCWSTTRKFSLSLSDSQIRSDFSSIRRRKRQRGRGTDGAQSDESVSSRPKLPNCTSDELSVFTLHGEVFCGSEYFHCGDEVICKLSDGMTMTGKVGEIRREELLIIQKNADIFTVRFAHLRTRIWTLSHAVNDEN
eukprot:23012_1